MAGRDFGEGGALAGAGATKGEATHSLAETTGMGVIG
jgi:hypothetical protein